MAIQVTTANLNDILNGARVVVRDLNQIPYVIVRDDTDDSIEVWKGDKVVPTTFTEQDTTNNPDATTFGSPSACIDTDGIIHIVYAEYVSKSSDLEYVQFNTATNAFQNAATISTDLGEEDTAVTNIHTAIAVDYNNVPHVVVASQFKVGGSTTRTITYNNRIGAAWNASMIEIEGATAGIATANPSLIIDSENLPCLSYMDTTASDVRAAQGNVNDATTFSLLDVDTDGSATAGEQVTSMALDKQGNHYVAFEDHSDGYIYIHRHVRGVGFGTWDTVGRLTDSKNGINPSLFIVQNNIYVLYEENTDHDIVYDKYSGTWGSGSWKGETVLEPGTFNTVKSRWQSWGYLFSSGYAQVVATSGTIVVYGDAGGTDYQRLAQVYVPSGSKYIDKIWLKAVKTGNPADSYLIEVVLSNDMDSDSPLARTNSKASSEFSTTANLWYEFTFNYPSSSITLTNGTSYAFRIRRTGVRDTSNYVSFYYTAPAVGSGYRRKSAGGWEVEQPGTLGFTIHFNETPTFLDYVYMDETVGSTDVFWNSLNIDRRVAVTHT